MNVGGASHYKNAHHLITQLAMVWHPLHWFTGFMSLVFFIRGGIKLAKAGKMSQGTDPARVVLYTWGAAAFFGAISFWINSLSNTLFNEQINSNPINRAPAINGQVFGPDMHAAFALMYIIGFITMIRAGFEFHSAGYGGKCSMPKAWAHLFGGVCLLNLPKLIAILLATVGLNLSSFSGVIH